MEKIIIYQMLTRLFGNRNETRKPWGTIEENGCGKMSDVTTTALKRIRELGASHVWYTGIIRHATQTDYSAFGIPRQHPAIVKGKAGSPYAITDYYDVDPDLAVNVPERMKEFEQLVQRTHCAGLKVIIDFVPNHVARQYESIAKPKGVEDLGEHDDTNLGFSPQNNFYYCPGQPFSPYFDLYNGATEPYHEEPAMATGNDHFDNAPGCNDWYETVKLNYGVDYYAGRINHFTPIPNTWHKMAHILLYWAKKGVDAFRCDMAEMVPAEFWAFATKSVRVAYPNIQFIGEVYNPAEYRNYIASGFDYLYDKVGMYDTLCDVIRHRRTVHDITRAWQQTDDIREHMLYFLENHDELRLASDFLVGNGLKAVPALITSALFGHNPFMLYAGQEYGECGMDQEGFSGHDGRTTIFDYWSVPSLCRAARKRSDASKPGLSDEELHLYDIYKTVLNIALTEPAVTMGQTFDLMYVNNHLQRQYAFLRSNAQSSLLVAVNFEDHPVSIDINIPAHAFEYLGIREKKAVAVTDLLAQADSQGKQQTAKAATFKLALKKDAPVHLDIPARGGVVLKF